VKISASRRRDAQSRHRDLAWRISSRPAKSGMAERRNMAKSGVASSDIMAKYGVGSHHQHGVLACGSGISIAK